MSINNHSVSSFSDIKDLELSPNIMTALRRSGMNNRKDILLSSLMELADITKLSRLECHQVFAAVSRATLKSTYVSCYTLLNTPRVYLTTGCPVLDKFLRGGLTHGGITEISGESASGKTQICLQLSVYAHLSQSEGGLNGCVAYICTEDHFPIKRLHQIIQELAKQNSSLNNKNITDNIFVTQVGDVDSLQTCIQKTLPQLVISRNIKLVVIDSIAAVFRGNYDLNDSIRRSRDIQSIGYSLHHLANQHKVIIICVNQVTDVLDEQIQNANKKNVPSLGLAWSNLVTTRIIVSRTHRRTEIYSRNNTNVKLAVPAVIFSMSIEFSPSLSTNCQAHFIVTPHGVFGLSSS